jgi:hypothetical protein
MSRCILVIDSERGELVDVAGNVREGGRYLKFAKRLLSTAENPVLDYGANGGDTLTVSMDGGIGAAINLNARVVNVPGDIKLNGESISKIISSEVADAIDNIRGSDGEIGVKKDSETGNIVISLSPAVTEKLDLIDVAVGNLASNQFVSRQEIANAIDGLSVEDEDDLDQVKGTLRVLLERLGEIAESSGSSSFGKVDTYVRRPSNGKYYKIIVVEDSDGNPTLDLADKGVDEP